LNQYWNLYRFHIVGRRAAGQISNFEVVRRIFEGFIVPALMIGAISRSRPAQDAKEFTTDIASMATATIPVAGNFISSAIKGWYGDQGLITTELFNRMHEISYQANKGEWAKVLAVFPELAGYAKGFPVAQPRRTIMAMLDLAEGKSDELMSLIWGTFIMEQAEEEKKPSEPTIPRRGGEEVPRRGGVVPRRGIRFIPKR